jgi:hypothetical protein
MLSKKLRVALAGCLLRKAQHCFGNFLARHVPIGCHADNFVQHAGLAGLHLLTISDSGIP